MLDTNTDLGKFKEDFFRKYYPKLIGELEELFESPLCLSEKLAIKRQFRYNLAAYPVDHLDSACCPVEGTRTMFLSEYGINHLDIERFQYHSEFWEYVRRERERAILL